jgi:hypothetical protein
MLAGNNARLHIVDRTGLEVEVLSRSRIRRSSEGVLARICMVDEVRTSLQGANVYTVVFDIDSHSCTRRVIWAIEVDGREVRAGVRNSRGLLARLYRAASG